MSKIILLATWPNGSTQFIHSSTGKLVEKSRYNQQLNKHVIEIDSPKSELINLIWSDVSRIGRSFNPCTPMVVIKEGDKYIQVIGSEFRPNEEPSPISTSAKKIEEIKSDDEKTIVVTEDQKDVAIEVSDGNQTKSESSEEEIVVDDEDIVEEDSSDEDEVHKLIASYGSIKVAVVAKNLGLTEERVIEIAKASQLLKVTGRAANKKVEPK